MSHAVKFEAPIKINGRKGYSQQRWEVETEKDRQAVRAQSPADPPTCHDLTRISEPEEEPVPSSNNLQPLTTPVVQTAAATAAEGERRHQGSSSAEVSTTASARSKRGDSSTCASLGELYRTHVLGMQCIEVESARPTSSDSPPPRRCDAGEPVTEQPIARTSEAADVASPSSAPWPLAAPRLPGLQERTQTDTDGVGGSSSKLAISNECSNSEQENTAAAGSPEAQGEIPEPADSTAAPAAFEAARVLKAGDTVKLLTGSRAGELGLVTEATAGDCEVDAEQWFARSQLDFEY